MRSERFEDGGCIFTLSLGCADQPSSMRIEQPDGISFHIPNIGLTEGSPTFAWLMLVEQAIKKKVHLANHQTDCVQALALAGQVLLPLAATGRTLPSTGDLTMKMRPEVYEAVLADVKAIIAEIDRSGLQPLPGCSVNPDALTMRDMWDIQLKANMDRGNADHPMYGAEGTQDRVLEYTDRSPYSLYQDEGLNDSHIETAFRKMIDEIATERTSDVYQAPRHGF